MIRNDQELALVREQLVRAETALKAIAEEVKPVSEARFLLMAESYVDMIEELRAQIEAYLGLNAVRQARKQIENGARIRDAEDATVEGVIREVDLDADTFVLRDRLQDEPELQCIYPDDAEENVKHLLDRRVVVTGRLRAGAHAGEPTLDVKFIQVANTSP